MALDSLNSRISNLTAGVTDAKMLEVIRRIQVILRELAAGETAHKVSRTWIGDSFPAEVQPNDLLINKVFGITYIMDREETNYPQQKVIGPEIMIVDSFAAGVWYCQRGGLAILGTPRYGPLERVENISGVLWNIGQPVEVFAYSTPALDRPVIRVSATQLI